MQTECDTSTTITITAEGSKIQSNYPDNLSLLDCCTKNKIKNKLQGNGVLHTTESLTP